MPNSLSIAEVILPVPFADSLSYLIPKDLQERVRPGKRVLVSLGKAKLQIGVVIKTQETDTQPGKLKEILACATDEKGIDTETLDYWQWVAAYYASSLGEVFKAAVPSDLRHISQIILTTGHSEKLPGKSLTERIHALILENSGRITMGSLMRILKKQKPDSHVLKLHEKGMIEIAFDPVKYPQTDKLKLAITAEEAAAYISKHPSNKAQKRLLESLIGAPWQMQEKSLVAKKSKVSSSVIKKLIEQGLITIHNEQEVPGSRSAKSPDLAELTEEQEAAYRKCLLAFKEHTPVLLHGVTSSGKTILYQHLIRDVLQEGKQVLYLLPEIAITTQIVARMQAVFGELAIFHSGYKDSDRKTVWISALNGDLRLVLGARSALFLPFANPGLIIVDESHDSSYKQVDPAPRYHARDAAVMLGHRRKIPVILGSATPSLESAYNTVKKKYQLVSLKQRYKGVKMPEIHLADLSNARKRKIMQGHFHPDILQAITECLEREEQVIILRNRKGYAPVMKCNACGWIPACPNCNVRLTYHKNSGKLVCHHCSYGQTSPSQCPDCGSTDLQLFGYGTEKIEESLALLFPEKEIIRFDQDAVKNLKTYQDLLGRFSRREADILVGTQMITKGMDFSHVGLIGVMHADQIMNFPDFRAFEKAYQLMEQVSGRAGRREKQGQVIIQTALPEHPILKFLLNHDYFGMVNYELSERKAFHYPPYVHLIMIRLRAREKPQLQKAANALYRLLQTEFPGKVHPPEFPVVDRIMNDYLCNLRLVFPPGQSKIQVRKNLFEIIRSKKSQRGFRVLRIAIDPDPQ